MPLVNRNDAPPMSTDTLLFILTGLHGKAATDKIMADMTKDQLRKEVTHETPDEHS